MKGPDGGSRHDPAAKLPLPMWQRVPTRTYVKCGLCRDGKKFKQMVEAQHGDRAGYYLVCPTCDGHPAKK